MARHSCNHIEQKTVVFFRRQIERKTLFEGPNEISSIKQLYIGLPDFAKCMIELTAGGIELTAGASREERPGVGLGKEELLSALEKNDRGRGSARWGCGAGG